MNGSFNRKITNQWSIFHCHVWLPEGTWFVRMSNYGPIRIHIQKAVGHYSRTEVCWTVFILSFQKLEGPPVVAPFPEPLPVSHTEVWTKAYQVSEFQAWIVLSALCELSWILLVHSSKSVFVSVSIIHNTHIHIHICIYVYTCMCIYIYICICICICICMCTYICPPVSYA